MLKSAAKQEQPQDLKKKLMSALAMLMIATTLMTTTSYAWFILSTAPEVTGITTNVGANGSLEIALLNAETRENLSLIRAGAGDSMVSNNPAANNAWGNLVDLGYVEYGLNSLLLLPARLNVAASGDQYIVDPGLLAVPTYGYDGRIVELTENTVSAIYQENAFSYSGGRQDYGVRAIGTSDALSVQGSALATAKSIINVNTNSARNNAKSVLDSNGGALFNIILQYSMNEGFDDSHRDTLKAMLEGLQKSLTDIDTALRQGLVAYAASEMAAEDAFGQVKDRILDQSRELTVILSELTEVGTVPAEFSGWVNRLAAMQNDLNAATNTCNELTGNSYTWNEIKEVLNYIMNINGVYIGETKFEDLDRNTLMNLVGGDIVMTLAPGSGIFADIADFTGNYNSIMSVMGTNAQIITNSDVNPKYMDALKAAVNTLNPADGGDVASSLPLTATYGYALDLAFRCNAAEPDLVLQTDAVQRVYSDSTSGSTQGGGSYMQFTSTDASMGPEARLQLMDAIRVGFVDDQGMILGIAKPNITSYSTVDGALKAPLYLYSYTFEADETGLYLVMGERLLAENKITDLVQNTAKAVTAIVWLDGDIVDNTMVSATEAASLNGVMNLQFATNANLNPSRDGILLNYTGDKTELEAVILANQEISEGGQGTYTTVSWNAFYTAYQHAVTVNENPNAGVIEIRNATKNLAVAAAALETVSKDAVNDKIAQLREMMGSVEDDTARYVVNDGKNGYVAVGGEGYTQDEYDGWEIVGQINRVDYNNKNMVEESNGIYTTTYTDESWNALAGALYEAEAIVRNPNATDEQLNAALSALEISEKALARQVYFKPYEYKGAIYYEAICDANNADTYGKWYDSSFKRIVSDVTIMNLNAYAQETVLTEIGQSAYVPSDADFITPDIEFMEKVYPELRGVEVKGVKWDTIDSAIFTEVIGDSHISKLNELITIVEGNGLTVDTANAKKLIAESANAGTIATAEAAEAEISSLNEKVVKALEEKAQNDNAGNMSSEQRILLTSAVNSAKAVEGYDTKAALKSAAEAAEALLTREGTVTAEEATTALNNLNAQLKAADVDEITVSNTLIHKLPEGFGADDIVYDCEFPGIKLKLTGKSGETTLGAQILTKDGVVMRISKSIVVYDRAPEDGLEYYVDGGKDVSPAVPALNVGDTAALSADLLYKQDAEGFVPGATDKTKEELVRESVKSYTWASGDTGVITVSNMNAKTCTITAAAGGSTVVSLSVETMEGNIYVVEIPVTVVAAP